MLSIYDEDPDTGSYRGYRAFNNPETPMPEPKPNLIQQRERCEPYANGKGWYHVPGCPHADWSDDV